MLRHKKKLIYSTTERKPLDSLLRYFETRNRADTKQKKKSTNKNTFIDNENTFTIIITETNKLHWYTTCKPQEKPQWQKHQETRLEIAATKSCFYLTKEYKRKTY